MPYLRTGYKQIAQKKTRTSMLLKALVPETSVSTNSTIWAYIGLVREPGWFLNNPTTV